MDQSKIIYDLLLENLVLQYSKMQSSQFASLLQGMESDKRIKITFNWIPPQPSSDRTQLINLMSKAKNPPINPQDEKRDVQPFVENLLGIMAKHYDVNLFADHLTSHDTGKSYCDVAMMKPGTIMVTDNKGVANLDWAIVAQPYEVEVNISSANQPKSMNSFYKHARDGLAQTIQWFFRYFKEKDNYCSAVTDFRRWIFIKIKIDKSTAEPELLLWISNIIEFPKALEHLIAIYEDGR